VVSADQQFLSWSARCQRIWSPIRRYRRSYRTLA